MPLLHLASCFHGTLIGQSCASAPHPHPRTRASIGLRRLKTISCLASAGLCLSLVSSQAWGQTDRDMKEGEGTIVAAGFGCQIGETSTITVKVYDAVSGEVLSDEVYELNVKEEYSSRPAVSQDRIFAGGVGLGAADLSNFMLRVYDAKTGKFQWEGKLNLTPREESGLGQMVSTVAPRRAVITKIHATETSAQQPVFSLRALDASTGGLVWEDEFSADGTGAARAQQITNPLIGPDESSLEASHTFDFRIRMFDRNGRAILWEDRVSQQEPEEDNSEAVEDLAHVLPAWPRQLQQDPTPAAI